ncbi:HIR complex subunit [Blastocladiella emersonii ATCC 22665]|nr:HIR complex subunit [Blastocladiella emersonii ATCC 22665]
MTRRNSIPAAPDAPHADVELLVPNFVQHGTATPSAVGELAGNAAAATVHQRSSIFSIDIHPDNERVVTGGSDHFVRMWSLHAIVDHAACVSPATPKELFAGKRHDGGVMCVRWASKTGFFLASGAEDGSLVVWQLEKRPCQVSALMSGGAGAKSYPETLSFVRKLPSMESDVIDLAWSHDNRFLASCSLDNTVMIWDGVTFDRVARCQHSSFVKGLAFDPVGTYLVSQSDDGSAILWNTQTWTVESRVTHAFLQGTGGAAVLVRRPSFSPDGSYVACANAVSNGVHVAALLPRGKWTHASRTLHLVGHTAPICVAKFAPVLVQDSITGTPTPVVALGANDRQVSVWALATQPVLVLDAAFDSDVTDLAWSPDARVLLACSREGRVVGVRLPASLDLLGGPAVPDAVLHARLVENGMDPTRAEAIDHSQVAHAPAAPLPAIPIAEHLQAPQRVTTTKDGRKRIQPSLIAKVTAPVLVSDSQSRNASAVALPDLAAGPAARRAPSPPRGRKRARHDDNGEDESDSNDAAAVSSRGRASASARPTTSRPSATAAIVGPAHGIYHHLGPAPHPPALLLPSRYPREHHIESKCGGVRLLLDSGPPVASMQPVIRGSGMPIGRQLVLDSPAVAACISAARAAVITRAGTFIVFDLWLGRVVVHDSVVPLLGADADAEAVKLELVVDANAPYGPVVVVQRPGGGASESERYAYDARVPGFVFVREDGD